jgi:NAD(P)-dependent dehydrogenase (short-subunit alcohol dehydrogenase family)
MARGRERLPGLAEQAIAVNLGLAGKAVVITGASKGIGLAVAQGMIREGARVAAGARENSADLIDLADNGDVAIVLGDLTTTAGCQALVDEAVARFGGVDVLVNNVGGVRPRTGGFLSVTDEDWQWALEMNLLSAVRATRAAVPHLIDRAPSTIVTVCSVNASLPDPGVIDYSAAKAALRSFCKSLSKELGPRGVRVNTVSPGPVETALWLGQGGVAETVGRAQAIDPAAVKAAAVAGTPTERFTRPDEVAELVLLLASGTVGNITGTDVLIDGGMVTTV